MGKGVLLGGILGGIVMFVWGALSHMALGLGSAGLEQIPNEETVLAAMKGAMPDPGVYFFPGLDPRASEQEQDRWKEKCLNGPSGIMAYAPRGNEGMTPRRLAVEFLSNIACALVAASILSKARRVLPGYGRGFLFVALLGFLPWLSISVSYWNWYGFSTPYLLAEGAEQVGGFALAGLAIAATVKGA